MKQTFVKLIVLIAIIVISNTAFAVDYEETIQKVGLFSYSTHFTFYIMGNSGREYSYSSELDQQNGIDILKSIEAQILYAKATGKSVLLRTTGVVNSSGFHVLWGVVVF